jgi:hypothetical protein
MQSGSSALCVSVLVGVHCLTLSTVRILCFVCVCAGGGALFDLVNSFAAIKCNE